MLILSDKVLAEAGLDFPTARALLAPAEAELVVHIRQEPVDRLNADVDSSLKHDVADGGDVLRPTQEASAPPVGVVPTIRPTNVLGLPTLPEHGASLGDLRAVAGAVGCAALVTDTGIEIVGPVAAGVYRDVSAAAMALNEARRHIANPPVSADYARRREHAEAGRVRTLPDEPPIGMRTAAMAEADLAPYRHEGETVEACAARLQIEANANVPPIVLLHQRGTSYTNNMRLGDISNFEE